MTEKPETVRVLHLDDCPFEREATSKLLSKIFTLKVSYWGVGDVRSFERTLSTINPDLILLDIDLEDGNHRSGLEVLRACAHTQPETPVVMLSHLDCDKVREECFMLGAKAVFSKTRDREKVAELLRQTAG